MEIAMRYCSLVSFHRARFLLANAFYVSFLMSPQGFGPEAKTRGGTLGVPACIHTRTKNICLKSKKCVCNGGKILDSTKLGAHGGLG